MRHTFDLIAENTEALRKVVRDADREIASRAGNPDAPPVYLDGQVSAKSRPLVYHGLKNGPFKSEVTGANVNRYTAEKDDVETVLRDQIDTTVEARMPLGYLIPAQWGSIADLLRLHGVTMERTPKAMQQEFETYRLSNPHFAQAPNEGHITVSFDSKLVHEKISVPANSYWVPMNQRRARLILNLLEPDAPDSFIRWGFLYEVFAGGERVGDYLSEPIARRMMAESPELRKQFEAKLASDPAFAANARARLEWWYQQSKYESSDVGRYPILRVWKKSW
jgi:hypothetical protein